MPELVELERDGAVVTVRLNRPERLNALGNDLRRALHAAVSSCADSDARVVVLEGAGRAFSAGADLRDGTAGPRETPASPRTWQQRRRASGAWGRLLDDLESLPQVTVASVHGYVIGGAMLLAAACDLRVADAETRLSIPEIAIGIPLSWGGIPRLVREIGISRAREVVLTGRWVGAPEAHAWGFVHRVGDRAGETARLVAELLAMPEAPLAMSKDALRAYGRTVVAMEASWSDPDLLDWARREPESSQAAQAYAARTVNRPRD